MRRWALVVTGLAGMLALIVLPASAASVPAAPAPAGQVTVQRAATARVGSLVGTDTGRRFGVQGADLGHMIAVGGRVAVVFGDTYGAPAANPFLSVRHQDWRSNTMGWLDPAADPAQGLRITDMVTDRPGHAKELLPSLKRKGVEETVIPTGGLAVGNRIYLQHMSVKAFGAPGRWTLNSSGIAHSDDAGQTCVEDPGAVWPGNSRFGQVAYVDPTEGGGDGRTVYVYGIPGGRYGGASLARVPAAQLADRAAYRYWTGRGWAANESAASTVIPGPVGELSVRYDAYYRTWLMMYLDDPGGRIVVRAAARPTGPWSAPKTVLTSAQYPGAYAPYLTPMWNTGPDVWFVLSQTGPYRVSLMRTRLTVSPGGTPTPRAVVRAPAPGPAPAPSPAARP